MFTTFVMLAQTTTSSPYIWWEGFVLGIIAGILIVTLGRKLYARF